VCLEKERAEEKERLTRILYEAMEDISPGATPFVPWEEVREYDKHFYRSCIEAILDYPELLRRLVDDGRSLANENDVSRRGDVSK